MSFSVFSVLPLKNKFYFCPFVFERNESMVLEKSLNAAVLKMLRNKVLSSESWTSGRRSKKRKGGEKEIISLTNIVNEFKEK